MKFKGKMSMLVCKLTDNSKILVTFIHHLSYLSVDKDYKRRISISIWLNVVKI